MNVKRASAVDNDAPFQRESVREVNSESYVQCCAETHAPSNSSNSGEDEYGVEGVTQAGTEVAGCAGNDGDAGPRFSMSLAVKAETFLNFVVAKLTSRMLKIAYTAVLALVTMIFKFIGLALSKIF
ncbi:hypothetical protein OTU49_001956 [Cherax quadricarinatus]|uniref:Uncharacterized protein n=1 Tax=Cherax quadricarinatus TaxID=27406 RepID=A0AAW0XE14_CHEQU